LGCGHPRKVTATSAKVTIVQNVFSLLMNQTSSKDSVNTTVIQGVVNDKITMRVVTDTSMLFTRNVRMKALGLKVKEDVSVPRIRGADEEKRFIRERISRFDVFINMRESTDKLCKHQGIFGFGLRKFKIKFLKDNDPFRILSLKYLTCQDVVHGLEYEITVVVRNKM
jgi:hypothetical protein